MGKKKRAEKDGHRDPRNGDDSDDSDSVSDSESEEELNTHLVKGRKKSKTSALISSSSGEESDNTTNIKKSNQKLSRVQFSDTDSDDVREKNVNKSQDIKSVPKHES